MSRSMKRRNSSSASEGPTPKKRRGSWMDRCYTDENPEVGHQETTVDPIYGQRGAFPGLDDTEDELIYGDPEDGIQYLRLVRNEAKDVPHILHRQGPADRLNGEQKDNDGEHGGYWEDGAYVATASSTAILEAKTDGQDQYYQALLERFAELQLLLSRTPPLSAIQKLRSSTPISFPDDSTAARRQWRQTIDTASPLPTQMACIDDPSVLNLLRLLTWMLSRTAELNEIERVQQYAVWVWAALARCRHCGELTSEEVAVVRELGKVAVHALQGMQAQLTSKDVDTEAAIEEIGFALQEARHTLQLEGDQGGKIDQKDAAEINARKEDQVAKTQNQDDIQPVVLPNENDVGSGRKRARISLDIIITIVGEAYGQRDLLETRSIWDEEGE